LAGRASTLRKKYNAACAPNEAAWRKAIAGCFLKVFSAEDASAAKADVLRRAMDVGELKFAIQILLPMIEQAQPE
jgi:hypothetical protein